MGILEIIELVGKGMYRLSQMVPLWLGAKTPEEREKIRVSAQTSVDALDPHFTDVDAKDKSAQDALRDEIEKAKKQIALDVLKTEAAKL